MPTLTPLTPRSIRNRDALGGGDVAGDQLDVAELLAERFDRARHHHRVAVGDVDDDDVGAGAQQLGGALEVVALRADRRADPQAAVLVARGEGQLLLLEQILRRDQAEQRAVGVDERQLLDLVRAHHVFGARRCRSTPSRTTRRSRGVMRSATVPAPLDEPEVAGRQQPDQAPAASSTTTSVPTPVRRITSRASRAAPRGEWCTGRR